MIHDNHQWCGRRWCFAPAPISRLQQIYIYIPQSQRTISPDAYRLCKYKTYMALPLAGLGIKHSRRAPAQSSASYMLNVVLLMRLCCPSAHHPTYIQHGCANRTRSATSTIYTYIPKCIGATHTHTHTKLYRQRHNDQKEAVQTRRKDSRIRAGASKLYSPCWVQGLAIASKTRSSSSRMPGDESEAKTKCGMMRDARRNCVYSADDGYGTIKHFQSKYYYNLKI